MNRLYWLFGALFTVCSTFGLRDVCAADVPALLRTAGYLPQGLGCMVTRLDDDSVLCDFHAESLFIPASVLKTVTAAAAYDILGQRYLFRTGVYSVAPLEADSGIIRGDVYIRGGGDPGFTAERLWLFVQQIANRGIRRVDGEIILDATYFDTATMGPGFGEDKSARAYEAPVGALSANFNSLEIYMNPGSAVGSPVGVRVFPPQIGLPVRSSAKTVAPGESSRGADALTQALGGITQVSVTGTMAVGAQPRLVYRKSWETTASFGRALSALLKQSGIEVGGGVKAGSTPDSVLAVAPLLAFESLPLSAYVGYLFKYSNNITAEMLLRSMARIQTGAGSWDSGAAVVRRWWVSRGFPGDLRIVNGSGMGSENRLSPLQTVSLLSHVFAQKSVYPDFCAALSNAGVDGTLCDRFTRSRLKGQVRAKTGTLNNYGVSSLAGYAFAAGKTYAFAIFVNDRKRGQFDHWVLQERLLEAILP